MGCLQGVGVHDAVLLLSGRNFGSPGVANGPAAGTSGSHVAIVKETVKSPHSELIWEYSEADEIRVRAHAANHLTLAPH